MATERDYAGNEVELTNHTCDSCGKQLNETEVAESAKYLGGERYVCTPELNRLMDLGEPKGCR